jgi:hypothetical protein
VRRREQQERPATAHASRRRVERRPSMSVVKQLRATSTTRSEPGRNAAAKTGT